MALFYSKSKDLDLRYLSNFEESEVRYKGKKFGSVEKAFQSAKYMISGCEDIAKKFELGNEYDNLSGNQIKQLGSKKGFEKNGCILDINKWNDMSIHIMEKLIESRYKNDTRFRKILDKYDMLFHFERSGEKSFWGGNWKKGDERNSENFRGNNVLGEIMMKIKNQKTKKKIFINN